MVHQHRYYSRWPHLDPHIQTGQFHDADELLEKAPDSLDERTAAAPTKETGAVVLAALRFRVSSHLVI
jgi:hypothetical protein